LYSISYHPFINTLSTVSIVLDNRVLYKKKLLFCGINISVTSILIWGIKQLTDNSSGKIRKSDLSLEISFIMQQCIKEVERGVVMNSLFS